MTRADATAAPTDAVRRALALSPGVGVPALLDATHLEAPTVRGALGALTAAGHACRYSATEAQAKIPGSPTLQRYALTAAGYLATRAQGHRCARVGRVLCAVHDSPGASTGRIAALARIPVHTAANLLSGLLRRGVVRCEAREAARGRVWWIVAEVR